MANKISTKLIISAAVIVFVLLAIVLGVYSFLNQSYKTIIEIFPEESFEVTVDGKTTVITKQEDINLKAGKHTIKVSKKGYDNYSQVINVARNNNNKFIIDMRSSSSSINDLSDINGIKNDFVKNNSVVDVNYIQDTNYWGVVVAQNKITGKFAIIVAEIMGGKWGLKFGPMFDPSILKTPPTLPKNVLNAVTGNAIEYFGERG